MQHVLSPVHGHCSFFAQLTLSLPQNLPMFLPYSQTQCSHMCSAVVDDEGAVQPIRVTRAAVAGAAGPPKTASTPAVAPVAAARRRATTAGGTAGSQEGAAAAATGEDAWFWQPDYQCNAIVRHLTQGLVAHGTLCSPQLQRYNRN